MVAIRVAIRSLVLVGALFLAGTSARAECEQSASQSSEAYAKAVRRLQSIPAVMDWQDLVSESGSTAKFLPPADWQVEIEGRCYWSVGLYSDEGTHFHLWHNYLVGTDGEIFKEADDEGALALSEKD
jgi:hypothetical protein